MAPRKAQEPGVSSCTTVEDPDPRVLGFTRGHPRAPGTTSRGDTRAHVSCAPDRAPRRVTAPQSKTGGRGSDLSSWALHGAEEEPLEQIHGESPRAGTRAHYTRALIYTRLVGS